MCFEKNNTQADKSRYFGESADQNKLRIPYCLPSLNDEISQYRQENDNFCFSSVANVFSYKELPDGVWKDQFPRRKVKFPSWNAV